VFQIAARNRASSLRSLYSPSALLAAVALLIGLTTGCASTGVIPSQAAGLVENPDDGIPVRIAEVSDERRFREYAGRRLEPTLRGDDQSKARRSQAIGRNVTASGSAGANIFLEAPLTVESVVRESIERALRAEGYRVLAEGENGADAAIPLTVAIDQFWAMRSPPSASEYINFEVDARVSGPLPGLETGLLIQAGQKIVRGGYSRAMWRQAMEQGLDDLTEKAAAEFGRVRLALDATPASRLVPSGLVVLPPPKGAKKHDVDFGKFYLLAIGIDEYETLPRLKTAVSDARAVSTLLSGAYGFETEILENATRSDVIQALTRYRERVGPRDNLLIYYAGHGWNDEEADFGYWMPSDADPDDETNWVSNAKITSILRAMEAKHVMVVSDSCYSGTLTRGIGMTRKGPAHIERLSARRTRLALTSGGNEPVVDGGGGKHSVFANAFLRSLSENEEVLDATTLHAQIRAPIMRDSDQTPQFGPIRSARHEDGDFLFVRQDEE